MSKPENETDARSNITVDYGSGTIAARRHGAAEIVDPKPNARGSLVAVFNQFPRVSRALPAMGYSPTQLEDLAATVRATDCESIVVSSPVDLARLIALPKAACRVRYDMEETGYPDLAEVLETFLLFQNASRADHKR